MDSVREEPRCSVRPKNVRELVFGQRFMLERISELTVQARRASEWITGPAVLIINSTCLRGGLILKYALVMLSRKIAISFPEYRFPRRNIQRTISITILQGWLLTDPPLRGKGQVNPS